MRHRFLRVWVIALVVVLVGAACGDDDDGGGGDAGGPTTEATAAEGDTTTTAGQAATGTPLTFGALCQESPPVVEVECYTTTQAVFDWYNAQGGLDGHPLELEHCDISASNPENMANCLQKLTGDSSVLAFVGNQGDEGIAALAEPAEMANIGPNILGLDAGTAPISFPLSPWGMGGFQASASYTVDQGAQKPAALYPDIQAGESALGGIKLAYSGAGIEVTGIKAAVDETTYTPLVAQAQQADADVLFILQPAQVLVTVFEDMGRLGYDPMVALPYTCFHDDFLEMVGSAGDGAVCAVPFDLEDEALSELVEIMDEYGPDDWKLTYVAGNSYLAAKALIQALESIEGEITRPAILEAMRTLVFEHPMLPAPVDFASATGHAIMKAAKMGLYYIYELDDGELVKASPDPVDTLG